MSMLPDPFLESLKRTRDISFQAGKQGMGYRILLILDKYRESNPGNPDVFRALGELKFEIKQFLENDEKGEKQ